MLRIGEFAELTGMSIHMLRNYDKIGLLIPALVDEQSGYRFYSEKQLIRGNQLQILKKLGFGLQEIRLIYDQMPGSDFDFAALIEKKIEEKEEEMAAIKRQMQEMRLALSDLNENEELAMSVHIKTIPQRIVASYRDIIHDFPEEGRLWQCLAEECERIKVKFTRVDYCFAIPHNSDFINHNLDVEVQHLVETLHQDTEKVKFKRVPACLSATAAFQGAYNKLKEISPYMADWTRKNGYRINGKSYNIYYVSPGNEADPDNFITEVCFPVEKI